ncbi:MAG: helix-turn-helix transcriptional regulator [Sporomusaceae bacterium]|nr:helix-turn-helix transcriptional regulator [Sporomusaceae bacterium]
MNIGQKIKKVREGQNMSVNTLAKLCKVSQPNLSRIENGQQQPAFDTLERIITALGYSLADFFVSGKPELEPDTKRLLDSIQTLSPCQRHSLYAFLEAMKE